MIYNTKALLNFLFIKYTTVYYPKAILIEFIYYLAEADTVNRCYTCKGACKIIVSVAVSIRAIAFEVVGRWWRWAFVGCSPFSSTTIFVRVVSETIAHTTDGVACILTDKLEISWASRVQVNTTDDRFAITGSTKRFDLKF